MPRPPPTQTTPRNAAAGQPPPTSLPGTQAAGRQRPEPPAHLPLACEWRPATPTPARPCRRAAASGLRAPGQPAAPAPCRRPCCLPSQWPPRRSRISGQQGRRPSLPTAPDPAARSADALNV
ncbi:hypothetical protein PAHAL_3G292600 [Panicum hallii]|uniref:Uncharacterized protein n=1 Tax=Panicum hallii TaxID=206008 RepID=A0A2T8KJS1_9POAL|nr:hypothetical protein PAHAL_3G292600 [Panicum hallii]